MAGDARQSILSVAIGLRIKKLRESFISASACAEKYGVTPSYWTKMEKGKVRFSVEDMYKLAEFFHVTPVWLLTGLEPINDDTGLNWDQITRNTPQSLSTWPVTKLRDKFEAISVYEVLKEMSASPNIPKYDEAPSMYKLRPVEGTISNVSNLMRKGKTNNDSAVSENGPLSVKFPPLTDIPGPSGTRYSFSGDVLVTRGLAAGGLKEVSEDDYGEPLKMPKGLLGVPVYGESMSPVILDKQLALIDLEREGFEKDDGIYVVSVMEPDARDERTEPVVGTFVKRVQHEEDTYYLKSVNDQYSPFPVYIDHCRLWPVIGVLFDDQGVPPEGF